MAPLWISPHIVRFLKDHDLAETINPRIVLNKWIKISNQINDVEIGKNVRSFVPAGPKFV